MADAVVIDPSILANLSLKFAVPEGVETVKGII